MGQSAGKNKYWVGFDLGGTKMMAAVFDRKFKAIGQKRRKTRGYEGVRVGMDRIVETIEQALEDAGITPAQVAGVGIGCPGPLDLDRGILIETPNLGWKKARLRERIGKAFGCPAVIANDVDAGVYGEYRLGAAKGARCVVGIFLGTGIGGGCVYEGRLIRGRTSSCFEIGHCRVLPEGPLCGCGQRGCLESVASRIAIAEAALAAAYRGEAPNLLRETGLDLAAIRSGALASAVKAGDKAIECIMRDAARWIGVAAATTVNLLNPDVVVLGGGLVEAMPALFVEEVTGAARKTVMPFFKKSFKVKVSRLGDMATAAGAAALARDSVEQAAG